MKTNYPEESCFVPVCLSACSGKDGDKSSHSRCCPVTSKLENSDLWCPLLCAVSTSISTAVLYDCCLTVLLNVLVSYCCYNKLPQVKSLKTIRIYSLTGLEVILLNQFHWAKVKLPARLVPSGDSEENSVSLSFQLLEVTCIPWIVVPFSIFRANHSSLCFCHHMPSPCPCPLSLSVSCIPLKDHCDYNGPILMIQDNFLISKPLI